MGDQGITSRHYRAAREAMGQFIELGLEPVFLAKLTLLETLLMHDPAHLTLTDRIVFLDLAQDPDFFGLATEIADHVTHMLKRRLSEGVGRD